MNQVTYYITYSEKGNRFVSGANFTGSTVEEIIYNFVKNYPHRVIEGTKLQTYAT